MVKQIKKRTETDAGENAEYVRQLWMMLALVRD